MKIEVVRITDSDGTTVVLRSSEISEVYACAIATESEEVPVTRWRLYVRIGAANNATPLFFSSSEALEAAVNLLHVAMHSDLPEDVVQRACAHPRPFYTGGKSGGRIHLDCAICKKQRVVESL